MDVRVLKTLVAVADHGTFAAAANVVGLSPSAVSMQIQALEQHLAVDLFDRTRRPPVLNEKGMALLPTARKIIWLHNSLRDVITSPDEFVGRLRLGVIPSVLSSFLPVVLAGLAESHPLLEIHVITGTNASLLKLLANEELDATIVGAQAILPSNLRWRPFVKEPICVIAPPDAPYDTAEELLRQYPYIKLIRGEQQQRMIDEQLSKMGLLMHSAMQLDSIEAITMMVSEGLGVSIVPQRSVEVLLRLPTMIIPFGEPPISRTLGLVELQRGQKKAFCDATFEQLLRACSCKKTPVAEYVAESSMLVP